MAPCRLYEPLELQQASEHSAGRVRDREKGRPFAAFDCNGAIRPVTAQLLRRQLYGICIKGSGKVPRIVRTRPPSAVNGIYEAQRFNFLLTVVQVPRER